MSHIIGRPGDDLLDIMLGGPGADPEQAVIDGSEEGDGAEQQPADDPTDAERPRTELGGS